MGGHWFFQPLNAQRSTRTLSVFCLNKTEERLPRRHASKDLYGFFENDVSMNRYRGNGGPARESSSGYQTSEYFRDKSRR